MPCPVRRHLDHRAASSLTSCLLKPRSANPAVQHGPNGAASGSPTGAAPEAGSRPDADPEGSRKDEGQEGGVESPFACVSAIMGWETFHMVHVLWIGLVDMPGKAPEKDWDMQVRLSCLARQ